MQGNVAVNPPNQRLQKRLLRIVVMGSDFAPLAGDDVIDQDELAKLRRENELDDAALETFYPFAINSTPTYHPPIRDLFDDDDIEDGDPRKPVRATADPLTFYRVAPTHQEAPFLTYIWAGTGIDDSMSRDTGLFASDFSLMVFTPEGTDPMKGSMMLDTIWQRLRRNRKSTSWKRLLEQSGFEDIFVFNRYADVEPESRLLRDGLDVRVWWRAEEDPV